MKASDAITAVELTMEESQNQRDARLEQLWTKLDYQHKGELDWKGLQRGLRKIDHRRSTIFPVGCISSVTDTFFSPPQL